MGSLRFDRDQRYQTLREVARRLGIQPSHTVLDVGGGTGELGAMLGCDSFWTADPLGGGPCHVTSSMDRLPFASGSFDLVLQADALEHVPQEIRSSALDEMARVTRHWLIWIGPVDSPETVAAEEDLCAVHKELFGGREMDWLTEHRRHGLPSGEEVIRNLAGHFKDWAWWRSCSLRKWWMFKRLELQLDTGPYSPLFEAALNDWYREEGWFDDFRITSDTLSYRSVFVGCKQGELPAGINNPPASNSLTASGQALAGLAGALSGGVGLTADGQPVEPSVVRQLDRIAMLLEGQAPALSRRILSRLLGW
jgi:SAM-dependent methyltransferase